MTVLERCALLEDFGKLIRNYAKFGAKFGCSFCNVSYLFCIFFGVVFYVCFGNWHLVLEFWEVPLFPLHVVSSAFDLELRRYSGKSNSSGELEREKQLQQLQPRGNTNKNTILTLLK